MPDGQLKVLGEVEWKAYGGFIYPSHVKAFNARADATDTLDEKTYVRHLYTGDLIFGTFLAFDTFNTAIAKLYPGFKLVSPNPWPLTPPDGG
jgi:hypothetical protein